ELGGHLGVSVFPSAPELVERAADKDSAFLDVLNPVGDFRIGELRKEGRIEVLVDIEIVLGEFAIVVILVAGDVDPPNYVLPLSVSEVQTGLRGLLLIEM